MKRSNRSAGVTCETLERRALLANIVVNTLIDGVFPAGSGTISLRNAILTANSATEATNITFDATVFSGVKTISLNGTELQLTNTSKATTIAGPSGGVIINGGSKSRVFSIEGNVSATMSKLTITAGKADNGGGISSSGILTLRDATVSGNAATDSGGGVINTETGTMKLERVTVSGNTATNDGGGITNTSFYDTSVMTCVNVTVSGNTAKNGGGINNRGGSFGVANITLTNVTIAGNTGNSGGGIYESAGPFGGSQETVANTIIAGNNLSGTGGSGPDAFGAYNSLSHNLVGKTNGSTGWSGLDVTGTIASPKDAKLGALANNGGPTQTRLPLSGSPAINAGINSLIPSGTTTDQRGQARIGNTTVDIGAVEVHASPPGYIAGQKFNDLDGDGVKDAGEPGLAGWTIYLDADKDGVKDATEKSATTDASGNYKLGDLQAGTYRVREVPKTGWRRTTPSSGYHDVTLTSGQNSTGKNFGNTQKVLISGTKWNDLDKDGVKDTGEPGLSGWTIYIDTDKDGVKDTSEKSVTTDASGNFSFKDLAAGTYRVREVPKAGWTQSAPSLKYHDVTLAAGGTATGKNFGNWTSSGKISGTVFFDDGDGIKETGEVGLQYRRIFIDGDKDGIYDPTEKFAISDASGNWALADLAAGTYTVRMVKQAGWNITTPAGGVTTIVLTAGQNKTGVNFGEDHV